MNEGEGIEKKLSKKLSNERAKIVSICCILLFLCLPQNAMYCGQSLCQNIQYVSSSFSNIPTDLVQLHHMKHKEFPRNDNNKIENN